MDATSRDGFLSVSAEHPRLENGVLQMPQLSHKGSVTDFVL